MFTRKSKDPWYAIDDPPSDTDERGRMRYRSITGKRPRRTSNQGRSLPQPSVDTTMHMDQPRTSPFVSVRTTSLSPVMGRRKPGQSASPAMSRASSTLSSQRSEYSEEEMLASGRVQRGGAALDQGACAPQGEGAGLLTASNEEGRAGRAGMAMSDGQEVGTTNAHMVDEGRKRSRAVSDVSGVTVKPTSGLLEKLKSKLSMRRWT
ncbi:hypothetical protein BCR37DRAFT_395967 [Protomyces lactucae-debilis]|uniref:Uncharacterized protein n=1 Tax=Protomyces lactucae-debilis TaxID=2754530 RepID=A0A1Y2EPF3_PROLT|nr:uncharacterized protein BCR37DRAFT_395967 [Protomyces lactucae-debilis]ORY73463.1 hypothetical protein BCR37DRAFT_395967 [Protomyces lactucae-debilis]